jgi:tetratricopeptide (TPR) repeat protein
MSCIMFRQLLSLSLLFVVSLSFARAAPDQWFQVSSSHFTVVTDSNERQAVRILDQFERMHWMFQTLFPKRKVDPTVPIVVIAARNRKSFQLLEPAAYLAKGQLNLDGLFLKTPDKNYVLLRLGAEGEHPYATIYHEYTHLQFSDAIEWMPLWLNEGLAEFVQNTEIRDKEVLLGEPSADDLLYLRQNSLLPLATLFKVDVNSPYYHEEQKASVFYAESWALTHYLEITDRQNNTHRLNDYYTLVSQHQDPVAAAEKVFGDLKHLQSELEYYIRAGSYKHFVVSSAAAPLDEASYKSRALKQAEADAVRADFLAYVQRTQDAQSLLDAVLKSDPDNVQAHETMGYLAFRNGDIGAARKWYEKAVKLDSQSYLAHYYFAVMSMREGNTQNQAEVEASLRAAIRLNPDFSPAYDQLAAFLAMRRQDLEEAHTLNVQAIGLDPGNLSYRMNASTVLMTMGRYADAASVLRNAVKIAKNPDEAAMIESRVKQIEAIQAIGAPAGAMVTTVQNSQVDMQTAEKVVAIDPTPKHPTEPPDGPKHIAIGVIRGVQCSYPSIIEFHVDTAKKPLSLYSNNFFKIDLTVLGFTPKGDMNPCKDFEGMKARVRYAESSDKSVDGQVIAVELRK